MQNEFKQQVSAELPVTSGIHASDATANIDQHQIQFTCISNGFPGIMTAGFFYPSILLLATGGYAFAVHGISIQDHVSELGTIAFFILFGGMAGFIISAFTAFVSILLIYCMNRSVGYPLNAKSAAVSAGSLAGYLPTAWIIPSSTYLDISEMAVLVSATVLATLLGAWGAAWSTKREGGIEYEMAKHQRRGPLSIKHLMWLTTWIAVTIAISNLFDGPTFAIMTLAWFVLQGTLLLTIQICRRIIIRVRQ